MVVLDAKAVQSSCEAALSNYSKWANSGFWASFFQVDLNLAHEKIEKLPSVNVREQMCIFLLSGIETASSSEMNSRLSYMEAVLKDMRERELSLLERYFALRRDGLSALFIAALSTMLIVFVIGMQQDVFSIAASTLLTMIAIACFMMGRRSFKNKYVNIKREAGNPGNRQRFILWGQS